MLRRVDDYGPTTLGSNDGQKPLTRGSRATGRAGDVGAPRRTHTARIRHRCIGTRPSVTRRMFGCTAVYADDRFLMILCDRENLPEDNGVWLGTSREHHASLRSDFPRMRSVAAFGIAVTAWQVLAQDDPEFEDMALHACALIKAGDPRIGKIPIPRVRKKDHTKFSRTRSSK